MPDIDIAVITFYSRIELIKNIEHSLLFCVTNDIIYIGIIVELSKYLRPLYSNQNMDTRSHCKSLILHQWHFSLVMQVDLSQRLNICIFIVVIFQLWGQEMQVFCFHTLIPASFCGPFMYSYCSIFSSKPSPLPRKIHKILYYDNFWVWKWFIFG